MLKRENWLNREVGVFLGASVFLFLGVLWCAFSGPEERDWGPVAVGAASSEWDDLAPDTREGPEVLRRYKSGRRPNPFLPLERHALAIGRIGPRVKGHKPTDIRPTAKPAKVKPPLPKPKPKKKPEPPKVVRQALKPWEKTMNVKGAWSIKGGPTFAFFESKETGEYWNVREGDEIAELGVKVVKVTASIIIVENGKGERFRLQDLIRLGGQEE